MSKWSWVFLNIFKKLESNLEAPLKAVIFTSGN